MRMARRDMPTGTVFLWPPSERFPEFPWPVALRVETPRTERALGTQSLFLVGDVSPGDVCEVLALPPNVHRYESVGGGLYAYVCGYFDSESIEVVW